MTLEELQAKRDELLAALANPTRVTQFESRRVEKHELSEMRAALAELDRQIGAMQADGARKFVLTTNRGLR
jgi:hypothetical protein